MYMYTILLYSVGVDKVTGLGLIGTNWAFELFETCVGLVLGGLGLGLDHLGLGRNFFLPKLKIEIW